MGKIIMTYFCSVMYRKDFFDNIRNVGFQFLYRKKEKKLTETNQVQIINKHKALRTSSSVISTKAFEDKSRILIEQEEQINATKLNATVTFKRGKKKKPKAQLQYTHRQHTLVQVSKRKL